MKSLRNRYTLFVLLLTACYVLQPVWAQDEHPPSSKDYDAASPGHEEEHDDHAGHDHPSLSEDSGAASAGHAEEGGGGIKVDEAAMRDFGIVVETAGPGTLVLQATLPGEVSVNEDRQAHIVPRFPGLAIDVRKTVGDQVRKGDVLAVLEGNESMAEYELKSLIDGTIIEKHITLGESLGDEDVVFTVADLDTVWVGLTVFQKNLGDIRQGEPVLITSDRTHAKGVISYVSPTLDDHTRTALARVVLDNPNGLWRPGMFVTAQVTVGEGGGGVVVPAPAVQVLENETVVFVPGDNGFITRSVEVGRRTHDQVEILSGLSEGEQYVAQGAFHLKAEIITSGLDPHAGHGH